MAKTAEEEIRNLLASNPDLRVDGYENLQLGDSVPVKRHKYSARRTEVDGITFDSKREAVIYKKLKLLEREGQIQDLALQPTFELQPAFTDNTGKKHRAITYKADFSFFDIAQDKTIVVDVKGYPTPAFRIKWKLLLYRYPDTCFEIWK